jgi:hypothetical protein
MWDFVMDESGAGAGFLRELQFPLPIYSPSASPQSSLLSPEAGRSASSLTNQILLLLIIIIIIKPLFPHRKRYKFSRNFRL